MKIKDTIKDWVEALITALILVLIIRTFLFEPYKIPTGSMEPTLLGDPSHGDKIIVYKLPYKYHFIKPKRWDVVVFIYPIDPTKDYIKRLIGLPGEKVEISNGDIFINDKIARKPPLVERSLLMLVYENNFSSTRKYDVFRASDNKWHVKDGKLWVKSKHPTSIIYNKEITDLYIKPKKIKVYCPVCHNYFKGKVDTAHQNLTCPYCSHTLNIFDLIEEGKISLKIVGGENIVSDLLFECNFLLLKNTSIGIRLQKDNMGYKIDISPKGMYYYDLYRNICQKLNGKIVPHKWYKIKISYIDGRFRTYLNKKKIVEKLFDVSPDRIVTNPQGWVSITLYKGEAYFDNFRLYRDIYYTREGDYTCVYVDKNSFFVLGDNSPNSKDSRYWKFVPIDNFLGEPICVFWPPHRIKIIH